MILKNPRPPKSIFFENNRNTLYLNEESNSSILEEILYGDIDNKVAALIKKFRIDELHNINFNTDDIEHMKLFLITLFWRIPKTDFAANDLINRSKISLSEDADEESIRNHPGFRKLNRAFLFNHTIQEMSKFGKRGSHFVNIHQNNEPILVLGDYPILFKKEINYFREFDEIDLLFAISSTRIYSSTNDSLINFDKINSFRYNAAVIHQSVRYIVCGNLGVLETSIYFYKELKKIGAIYSNERVFVTSR